MRKATLTLTVLLCVLLLAAGSHSASTRERRDAHLVPLPNEQETYCNFPEGRPGTAIAALPYASAQPSARNSLTATNAAFSGNSFAGFVRCPDNDPANPNCTDLRRWKPADDGVGYYRDVIFSATTLITNAKDGEQWGMTITRPDGSQFSFSPVTFTSTGNCFIFPSQQICGATGIEIYWYFNSQCAMTGQWKADAKYGESVFASMPFVIKPQLGSPDEIAARMPPLAQKSYPNETYAGLCHTPDYKKSFPCSQNKPGQVPWTIAEIGCTLVSLTSILNYHGVQTDPVKLDKWLLDNNYYRPHGEINLNEAATKYALTQNVELTYYGLLPVNDMGVFTSMCQLGPMMLRVLNNYHTVTSTGADDTQTTFTILDAKDGLLRNLTTYGNKYDFYVAYGGKMHTFTDRSGVKFTFHSPVESFVVDPLGRRKGLDPRTGVRYDEIPDAFYGEFSTIGPMRPEGYEPPKLLNLPHPAEGVYTLTVVGTGTGTYDAEFTMSDQNGDSSEQRFVEIATAPGVVHTYQVEFSKTPGAQIRVAGGFDGGGQRPRDVNKFLSYAQPSATSTALPEGATTYSLLVFYGQTVIPSTLRAQLNGADITSLFNASPGGGQTVALPLQRGRNVLQLSVDGQLPNRVATDSDRLVFDVP